MTGTFIDRAGYELPLLMGLTVMFSSTLMFSLFTRYDISLVQWGRSSVDIQDRRVRRHQQGHKFNINSTEHTHTHDRRRIAHIRTQTNLISFLATAKRTRVMSTLSLTLAPIDLIHTHTQTAYLKKESLTKSNHPPLFNLPHGMDARA